MRSLLLTGIALVALLAVSPAGASPGGEGGNTGCNGQGNPNSTCVGQGGNGGNGGNAVSASRATARANAAALGVGVGIGRGGSATGGAASATGGNASVTVSGAGGGGGSYTYNEANGSRRVPDVSAPAIWSNNPCVVALSGGVSVAGFGASIGAGVEDRDCTRRANAQHLTAMGERDAAREVLCESAEVRAAFARIGRPCVADQQRPAAAPVAAVTPVAVAALPPAQARIRPDWCYTRDREVLARPECRQ